MRKNRLLYLVFIIFLFGLIALIFANLDGFHRTGFDITVVNETDKNVSGLKITYHNIAKDLALPIIAPKGIYKFNISPNEQVGENSMSIYYFDKYKNKHSEMIFGYFEKGYYGQATIKLTSFDKNGKMNIQVKGNVFE